MINREAQKHKLRELLRKRAEEAKQLREQGEIKKQENAAFVPYAPALPENIPEDVETEQPITTGIVFNEEQNRAIQYGSQGIEFCLIGAAGTGKTTVSREVVSSVIKFLGLDMATIRNEVAILCYTRRASRNAAKALKEIGGDKICKTAHKFLEYAPEKYEYETDTGELKTTMRFAPQRTALNPIWECKLIIVDEASMLDNKKLHTELKEACPNAKFIYIGDLNQLPPVFGDGVLGYKLVELPVVELTQVYRQAMDSPIIAFQHQYTLKGIPPSDSVLDRITSEATDDKGLEFKAFKKDHDDGAVLAESVSMYMIQQLESGKYNPLEDTILIPYNKSFGSIAINYHIAEYLGKQRNAVVWEIMAGIETKYLAVDDFVMYEKRECIITSIDENPRYIGKPPQTPSSYMKRNGLMRAGGPKQEQLAINLDNSVAFLDMTEFEKDLEDTEGEMSKQASAIVTIRDTDTGAESKLSTVGEVSNIDFGYCMTIHKSQGSEWRKVWLIVHKFHATMLNRELLYTGMTRAKDKLTVIYSKQTRVGKRDSSIAKCISRASIPGKSWQEKVKYFQKKM